MRSFVSVVLAFNQVMSAMSALRAVVYIRATLIRLVRDRVGLAAKDGYSADSGFRLGFIHLEKCHKQHSKAAAD